MVSTVASGAMSYVSGLAEKFGSRRGHDLRGSARRKEIDAEEKPDARLDDHERLARIDRGPRARARFDEQLKLERPHVGRMEPRARVEAHRRFERARSPRGYAQIPRPLREPF